MFCNNYCLYQQCSGDFMFVTQAISYVLYPFEAKSRKYQGVFEVKSRVKTWQVRGIWSQQ